MNRWYQLTTLFQQLINKKNERMKEGFIFLKKIILKVFIHQLDVL
jgi:hypothetical protein